MEGDKAITGANENSAPGLHMNRELRQDWIDTR